MLGRGRGIRGGAAGEERSDGCSQDFGVSVVFSDRKEVWVGAAPATLIVNNGLGSPETTALFWVHPAGYRKDGGDPSLVIGLGRFQADYNVHQLGVLF